MRAVTLLGLRGGILKEVQKRGVSGGEIAPPVPVFTNEHLNLRLNSIYDLPEVRVSGGRSRTINVLVPAFDFNSISAGFFGVFNVALFLKRCGHHVRLVMFDRFHFDEEAFRRKLEGYPGMEDMFDELEVEYIGDRARPLLVSRDDVCVATVWYSAYLAEKIMGVVGGGAFLYLIQDYETNFFPGGSQFVLADATYDMDYVALFSTSSLMAFFEKHDIGGIVERNIPRIFFNNASASNLIGEREFFELNTARAKRSLVFYSRPIVDRNMFELTALALQRAYESGIFDLEEWDCIGMGLGEGVVQLPEGRVSQSLPRMTLKEYQRQVAGFDICLTLMASPHPSLIPMDLAGSGALVVTNTFRTKTASYLRSLSGNIIPAEPRLDALVEALAIAKARSDDLAARYANARAMTYPTDWAQSLTGDHSAFIAKHLLGNRRHAETVATGDRRRARV